MGFDLLPEGVQYLVAWLGVFITVGGSAAVAVWWFRFSRKLRDKDDSALDA